jgi:hypothetical protein
MECRAFLAILNLICPLFGRGFDLLLKLSAATPSAAATSYILLFILQPTEL